MGGRWTFKYKRDENGALSKVSHRSRYVAKGFTQIKNVHYFESFAPVASFVTLRLVFALTALPHFQVNHYDVSVAFIESELDESTPPVYCECAEGYEDPREYVYLLHKGLYGMIQSPRAWYQLWCTICTSFGLQKLVTDGCVHIKYVDNKKNHAATAQDISTIWPGTSNICLSMIVFIPIVLTTRSSSSWSHTSTTTSSLQTAKPCLT